MDEGEELLKAILELIDGVEEEIAAFRQQVITYEGMNP